MTDYKRMYLTLVNEVVSAIDRLQAGLEQAEDIFIESDETEDTAPI